MHLTSDYGTSRGMKSRDQPLKSWVAGLVQSSINTNVNDDAFAVQNTDEVDYTIVLLLHSIMNSIPI